MSVLSYGILYMSLFLILTPFVLPVSEAQVTVEDNMFKLDYGFYEKIEQIQANFTNTLGPRSGSVSEQHTLPTHSIIIITNDGDEQSLETTLRGLNATNIFVDTTLNYIIAEIPIDQIVPLVVEEDVVKIGDGQEPLTEFGFTSTQKTSIGASNIPSKPYNYTGKGVIVSVIENDSVYFGHNRLMEQSEGSVRCNIDSLGDICSTDGISVTSNHATSMAGIVAANNTSDPAKKGIAPDSLIYSIESATPTESHSAYLAYAVSHTVTRKIPIAMASVGDGDPCMDYTALAIIIDRAVKEGLSYSAAVGNIEPTDRTNTVGQHACGFNLISVGSVDVDRDLASNSRIGPATFTTPSGDTGRIKPEITALGVDIKVPVHHVLDPTRPIDSPLPIVADPTAYVIDSGTSHANAVVAGASALILEKQPDYMPLEIKASLLIGADWKAITPATATDYDNRRDGVYDKMNKYGFGVLNIEKSLDYANSNDFPNIIYETSNTREGFNDKQYMITVPQNEQVKVLLTWLLHPRGSIINPTLPIDHPPTPFSSQFHNYDVTVSRSDGTVIETSDSDIQNNEFVVFDATPGNYVITVSSDGALRTDTDEPFVIASTHPLTKLSTLIPILEPNNPPTISVSPGFIRVDSGDTVTMTATVSDPNNDSVTVSWGFGREDIAVVLNISADTLTASFDVPYHDSITRALYLVTAIATDEHGESSSKANGVVEATISPTTIIDTITQFFESTQTTFMDLVKWILATPHDSSSLTRSGNMVLSSNNCDTQCIATMISDLDTSSPLTIEFDRFVDSDVGSNEGLYVQYSTDDTRWTTLASYTHNNRQDTDEWEEESLTLDITQSTASLRFVAKSSSPSEYVEIDNLSISPRVADTTPPTFTYVPPGKTFEATGVLTPLTISDIETATAEDMVDPNPIVTSNIPPSFEFGIGTTIITWTATDSSGNSDIATQIITVQDTTPPAITKPTNKTFEATGEQTPLTSAQIGTATATDLVDPNPTVTSNIPQSFEFNVTATPITWTATDSYGNSDTVTQIITIRDTTSPTITAPADVSFTTTDTSIALTSADYGTATATDLVDPAPTITNNAPQSFRADHTTTITWTATDDYGNSAQATQSVTVVHSSLRIFVPIDITVEATGPTMSVDIGTATATHDTDTNLTISNNATSTSFQVGTTTILWTVVDSIGVTVTDTQRITVQDTTDPILYSVPDLDFVFEIDIPIIINYDYPTATDLADDSVDVACTPASGTIFNENTTVVTCTATDNSGNTADTTFNVNVVVFDPNIFSDNFEDGNMDGWTVTDHVDTWAAVPLEENVYPPGHASTNKVAEVIFCDITCSMTTSGIDLSGHDDPIFLQFYRYADSSLNNDSYFQVETYNGSSWVVFDKWIPDNFHHDGAWHLEQYSLSDYTHVRDFGMRFTAYMDSSSESVGIDDVRVFFVPEQASDGTVPVIVPPVSIVAEAAGAFTTVDIGNATATPATNITNDAPTSFPLGSTTVTWTATDSSDNSDTATQRITVHDTTRPDITAPADVSFTITGASIALTASDYGASTATDLVDSSPTITDNAPDLFPLGNTTITWTATDDYGNSAQATQQVTVILSSLMITAPADITAEATGTLTTVDIGNAIATHDTDTNITITNDAPLSFRVGTTTVITWTATDSVNDVVTDTQRITVQDTTNPVFSSVTDLDFIFEPGVTLVIDYDSPTATDSVNGSVDVTCVPASGTVFSGGTTGVTCTAADNSGNTADVTFNVDVLVLSTTIFLDDFEDRRLDGWTVTDYSDTWDSYPQESGVNPPDHPSTNKVAQVSWCDITCTMSITGFDLSGNAYPEFLQFYRYVDDELDNGEYLSLEVYDGSSWTELDRWTPEDSDDDDAWHLEEYSLADYTEVTDFGMRFTTVMSSLDEAVAIDDVKIFIVP